MINKSQSECTVIRRFDYQLLIAPFFFDDAIFEIKRDEDYIRCSKVK